MKNIKYIALAVVAVVGMSFFTSCEDSDKHRFPPELGLGGFVKFVSEPYSWEGLQSVGAYSITKYYIGTDPLTSSFNASVEDPNGNVAKVEFFVEGHFTGAPADPIAYMETTSFPFDVSFTTADMAALFGVDASVFEQNDDFEFSSIITTTDGRIFNSTASGCACPEIPGDPGGTGTWNGGTIDAVIIQGGDTGGNGILPAVAYSVQYRAPSD
jgi:hypothetical protein